MFVYFYFQMTSPSLQCFSSTILHLTTTPSPPPSNPFFAETVSELMSALPNKLKFVVYPSLHNVRLSPKALLVGCSFYLYQSLVAWKVLPGILNKRWKTLDLKSILSELQRCSSNFQTTADTLSSVHRFKRKKRFQLVVKDGWVSLKTIQVKVTDITGYH